MTESIYLVNQSRQYYPEHDNTVKLFKDFEQAKRFADNIRNDAERREKTTVIEKKVED